VLRPGTTWRSPPRERNEIWRVQAPWTKQCLKSPIKITVRRIMVRRWAHQIAQLGSASPGLSRGGGGNGSWRDGLVPGRCSGKERGDPSLQRRGDPSDAAESLLTARRLSGHPAHSRPTDNPLPASSKGSLC